MAGAACVSPWLRAGERHPRWLSTGRDRDGRYWLAGVGRGDDLAFKSPLPGRAHGFAVAPDRPQALVFARRPGNWAGVFSPLDGRISRWLEPPRDHLFVGHGCWLEDRCWVALGSESSDARLGIWSPVNGHWTDRIALPGIGAHEVVAHPGGEGLAVAVGGLDNSVRASGEAFRSALILLDGLGRVRTTLTSPRPGFSVRHLDADEDHVYVGLQYYGPDRTDLPLVYRVAWRDPAWQPLPAEPWQWLQMNSYIASVVCGPWGVSVSSPKGHHVMHWRFEAPVAMEPMRDVAALAGTNDRLWAGNGLGQWRRSNTSGSTARSGIVPLAWDNHGAVAWV
ncbi:hypothetical protein GCM10007392_28510 [Saccharospirillum salsuginis]|uniref:Uncharacterized protein n=2 Tax=Saccharospirillum salsuginis TaxID=418750 RepID=A0A918KCX0_9GAMM|nr:hypothetical protein GCM10007392_28510 [Saccharospirillum salsuginis]